MSQNNKNNGTSKTLNKLSNANRSKFVSGKWNIVSDNSKANYNSGNNIIYNTEVLRADHCDYNNAYILIRGDIFVRAAGGA